MNQWKNGKNERGNLYKQETGENSQRACENKEKLLSGRAITLLFLRK